MHKSSYDLMRTGFINKYLDQSKTLNILDVGSMDINGTYRPLFSCPNWIYTGMDLEAGKNVDIMGWENIKPYYYDVVISGQCLEHVERPWDWIGFVKSVVKQSSGLICIIVPHVQKEHKYPIDCWRVFPDGIRALFDYANIRTLEAYKNPVLGTRDTIGIGYVGNLLPIGRVPDGLIRGFPSI